MEKQSVVNVVGFKANSNQINLKGNHNLKMLLGACLLWLDSYDAKVNHHDGFTFVNPVTNREYDLEPATCNQSSNTTRIISKLFSNLVMTLVTHQEAITITKEQILPILYALNLFDGTMYGIYGKQRYFDTNTYKYIINLVNGMIRIRQDNHI